MLLDSPTTKLLAGACIGLGVACSSPSVFFCGSDADCGPGPGRCEASGYCSFPDGGCPSGYRFSEFSGDGFSGACTDLGDEGDGSSAAPGSNDSPLDATTGGPADEDDEPSSTDDGGLETTSIAQGCPSDWWDCAWAYRRELTISGQSLGHSLTDFPVPIELLDVSDPERFGDGTDLRLVDELGRVLDFEVEAWDPGGGAVIWTRAPELEAGAELRVWLYYGNPSAPPGAADSGVWDEEFVGVWHLGSELDATRHANDALDEGSISVPGALGLGRAFNGSSGRMLISDAPVLHDLPLEGMTITAWIFPHDSEGAGGGRILDKSDSLQASTGWQLMLMDGSPSSPLRLDRGGLSDESKYRSENALEPGQWQFVALRFVDGELPEFWADDAALELESVGVQDDPVQSDEGLPLAIGGVAFDDSHTFHGVIDELRISCGLRSDAWLRAEYLAGRGELVTLGAEQVQADN